MMAPTPGPIPGTLGQVVSEPHEVPAFIMAPRKSMTVSTKGLLNMPGQNNCFLNSAVQVLWHLDTFRRNFRELTGHACMAESCIFCALKELFTQFQYSQESALPPDALRHALAKTFCDQRRFQLGFMDDAAECFENILLRIHVHIANQESEDMCSNANCIPHQKFAMTLVEQRICHSCGARSDPLPFTQMVHYVTTSALCAKSIEKQILDPTGRASISFGNFLKLAGDMGEVRDCPSNCGSKVQVKKTLMNQPEVVSIGLVWDSESPTLQHITDVFHSIGMFLQLQDMFHYVYDVEWASNTTHQLVGVVTYYGKHYSTFFFHTKLKIWIYFDDATVREIGPSWEQVVEKCQRGRFQPLLLLFANPESSIDNDHPIHFANRTNEIKKSTPFINQRQAVINQYLKFQNSINYNTSAKFEYIIPRNLTLPNPALEPYANSVYRNGDQGLPIYQNTNNVHPTLPYNQGPQSGLPNGSHPPMYSNLQYLNSLPPKDQTVLAKLNEVSLPLVKQLPSLKPYNTVQANEILMDKKDFDAAKDSDSAFTEEDPEVNDMYISRKTVENVLSQQKRHLSLCRSYSQSSVGNRNSSSSLESFDNIQPNKLSPIKSQLPENIPNRRDSGSWSSDRNSCSSNNSTENPFLTVVSSKRLLLGLNKKSQLPDYSNTNTSDHGYDSYSVSSSDSYPSVNGSPVKLDPRMTQIPEDWQPEEDNNLDQKLKLVTEDTNGPPDCDKLCAEADLLLAKSHEKEKDGDLVMAALLCDSAAARARAAMEAPYNNSRSLVSAKMKHSTCVMRSANLYRRLKDHELDERRKQKGHTGHHSRQSSRDSTHSKHSRQSSKDSTHSKSGSKEASSPNSDDADTFGKNIEIYGTLPKKGSRKKNAAPSGSLKTKDDQVYKDFLDKQRKNTSLAESLNETMMKNVDVSHTQNESISKAKSASNSDKSHRKSYPESALPKSPTRKKSEPQLRNSDSEGRKRVPKMHTESSLNTVNKNIETSNRDLLSPISSPDKKQHKIKRKLMGGFMKRKNRSLPDLREDQDMSDRIDCFLDDAIIQVPSTMMLPNGKSKKIEKQPDTGVASITRGFHQPHHAFVKKDLTQRPLLMKVNPPNIQPSILTSPKSKLVHTLPSIPKKPQDIHLKLDSTINGIPKPSKIPFISPFPKCEPPNLPPLSPTKSFDMKMTTKSAFLNKTSAIPVLTPQVSLASLKAVNLIKEDPVPEITKAQTSPEKKIMDKEDLPQPSNPFLAELQEKRKQVLEKSSQNENQTGSTVSNNTINKISESKELSTLPKLAYSGEGTSWLRELQNKQQQLLNKQDIKSSPKPVSSHEVAPIMLQPQKNTASITMGDSRNTDTGCTDGRNVNISKENPPKINSDTSSKIEPANNSKSTNSVKDIASRFEKVLKMPQQQTTISAVNKLDHVIVDTARTSDPSETNGQMSDGYARADSDATFESIPTVNLCASNSLPLKPAIKAWTDFNTNNEQVDTKFNLNPTEHNRLPERTAVKPILKQDSLTSSSDSTTDLNGAQRPMRPPDYATAMQRLELIRTTNTDANLLPVEPMQIKTDAPKKKQGPKKTVTFSDEVVLVACAEYDEIDFSSNPLFERVYQQHVESGKGEIPILSSSYNPHGFGRNIQEEALNECNLPPPPPSIALSTQCNLCHNKEVSSPNSYCTDCEFYLSRFKP